MGYLEQLDPSLNTIASLQDSGMEYMPSLPDIEKLRAQQYQQQLQQFPGQDLQSGLATANYQNNPRFGQPIYKTDADRVAALQVADLVNSQHQRQQRMATMPNLPNDGEQAMLPQWTAQHLPSSVNANQYIRGQRLSAMGVPNAQFGGGQSRPWTDVLPQEQVSNTDLLSNPQFQNVMKNDPVQAADIFKAVRGEDLAPYMKAVQAEQMTARERRMYEQREATTAARAKALQDADNIRMAQAEWKAADTERQRPLRERFDYAAKTLQKGEEEGSLVWGEDGVLRRRKREMSPLGTMQWSQDLYPLDATMHENYAIAGEHVWPTRVAAAKKRQAELEQANWNNEQGKSQLAARQEQTAAMGGGRNYDAEIASLQDQTLQAVSRHSAPAYSYQGPEAQGRDNVVRHARQDPVFQSEVFQKLLREDRPRALKMILDHQLGQGQIQTR